MLIPFIDPTQREILQHLEDTETLLGMMSNGKMEQNDGGQIIALPDLGLPNSVGRALGGFYTGALYRWESERPVVPIDTTVNVCGVAVFELSQPFESQESFFLAIKAAMNRVQHETSYMWNFDSGNHFILTCRNLENRWFLVLHASACGFKNEYNGLYPSPGNWYSDWIDIVAHPSKPLRKIRFLSGRTAERFFLTAKSLEQRNSERMRQIAALICGRRLDAEILNMGHYGMPDQNSVAIGCQLISEGESGVILTRSGSCIYLFEALEPASNSVFVNGKQFGLFPHGFGCSVDGVLNMEYRKDNIVANGNILKSGDSFRKIGARIRGQGHDVESIVTNFMRACPGRILERIYPVFGYSGDGFTSFENNIDYSGPK